jgi:hypothetical protein
MPGAASVTDASVLLGERLKETLIEWFVEGNVEEFSDSAGSPSTSSVTRAADS